MYRKRMAGKRHLHDLGQSSFEEAVPDVQPSYVGLEVPDKSAATLKEVDVERDNDRE